MDTDADFDHLDQALARTAARHASPPFDPRRFRRRARLEVGPVVRLLFVCALTIAAAVDRSWWAAGVLALVLGPGAVAGVVARRRELAALGDAGDFAAYERRYFAAQAQSQRSAVLLEAMLAVVFAVVAWRSGEAWRWGVPALFGVLAAGRAVTVLPYVERANRDAGGDRPHGWAVLLLLLVLFLLTPLLLVAAVGRGVWTRITRRTGGGR